MGQQLARDGKVLYVGLEVFSGFDSLLHPHNALSQRFLMGYV
mgnify:CR=1 FL=1